MNSAKTRIKVGDKVKIINPEFFVKCGYDNNLKSQTEKIKEDYKDAIKLLIETVFPYRTKKGMTALGEFKDFQVQGLLTNREIMENKIASALAYEAVRREIKSGAERKVFTKVKELGIGWDCYRMEVLQTKTCWTGKYFPSSGGYDYYGEYGYEPGGLSNAKCHRLLYLENGEWIEDIHVEKVNETGS